MPRKKDESPWVYSTDPEFQPPEEQTEVLETLPPNKQDLRITLDKKLKGNKKATVVYNFKGREADLASLGKQLKQKCGVGGSVKDGEIILQGDCLRKVQEELARLGYRYKLAGI